MSQKPAAQIFIDEIKQVIEKHSEESFLTYCEVIGCLEIISRDIYQNIAEHEDEDEII
jgi:hypothetical protein